MHYITRAVCFGLGVVILVDALRDDPTPWVDLLIGLVLTGAISLDQLVALVRRDRDVPVRQEMVGRPPGDPDAPGPDARPGAADAP